MVGQHIIEQRMSVLTIAKKSFLGARVTLTERYCSMLRLFAMGSLIAHPTMLRRRLLVQFAQNNDTKTEHVQQYNNAHYYGAHLYL